MVTLHSRRSLRDRRTQEPCVHTAIHSVVCTQIYVLSALDAFCSLKTFTSMPGNICKYSRDQLGSWVSPSLLPNTWQAFAKLT